MGLIPMNHLNMRLILRVELVKVAWIVTEMSWLIDFTLNSLSVIRDYITEDDDS